eukprot:scaffold284188_cov26-Tisochrysis_lutea.AAC.1
MPAGNCDSAPTADSMPNNPVGKASRSASISGLLGLRVRKVGTAASLETKISSRDRWRSDLSSSSIARMASRPGAAIEKVKDWWCRSSASGNSGFTRIRRATAPASSNADSMFSDSFLTVVTLPPAPASSTVTLSGVARLL